MGYARKCNRHSPGLYAIDDEHQREWIRRTAILENGLEGPMVVIGEVALQRLKIGNQSKQKTIFENTCRPVLMKHTKLNHFLIKRHYLFDFELYIEVWH